MDRDEEPTTEEEEAASQAAYQLAEQQLGEALAHLTALASLQLQPFYKGPVSDAVEQLTSLTYLLVDELPGGIVLPSVKHLEVSTQPLCFLSSISL
jgi:hypothetical protein